jgi:hypothetical protein
MKEIEYVVSKDIIRVKLTFQDGDPWEAYKYIGKGRIIKKQKHIKFWGIMYKTIDVDVEIKEDEFAYDGYHITLDDLLDYESIFIVNFKVYKKHQVTVYFKDYYKSYYFEDISDAKAFAQRTANYNNLVVISQ